MTTAVKQQSPAHDVLAVLSGFGLLAFFHVLLALAFWLRHGYPLWEAF